MAGPHKAQKVGIFSIPLPADFNIASEFHILKEVIKTVRFHESSSDSTSFGSSKSILRSVYEIIFMSITHEYPNLKNMSRIYILD